MKNQAPKLRLIKGNKKEPKFHLNTDLLLISLGIAITLILAYKAAQL